MIGKMTKIGLTGILLLLMSNVMMISAANPDVTKMGVSNGDTFTFVVDKATSLFGEGYFVVELVRNRIYDDVI